MRLMNPSFFQQAEEGGVLTQKFAQCLNPHTFQFVRRNPQGVRGLLPALLQQAVADVVTIASLALFTMARRQTVLLLVPYHARQQTQGLGTDPFPIPLP